MDANTEGKVMWYRLFKPAEVGLGELERLKRDSKRLSITTVWRTVHLSCWYLVELNLSQFEKPGNKRTASLFRKHGVTLKQSLARFDKKRIFDLFVLCRTIC